MGTKWLFRLTLLIFGILLFSLGLSVQDALAEVVSIPDANLAAEIRRTLKLAPTAKITEADMMKITELTVRRYPIKDITGLEHAKNLRYLNLSHNLIHDITALAGLENLETLYLSASPIEDISPLAGLTRLTKLIMWGNRVRDLKPLRQLTQLEHLDLNYGRIRDITALSGLGNLERLYLVRNQIRNLTPLAKLTALKYLWIGENPISNVTALQKLTHLESLSLRNTQVRNIRPLRKLTHLTHLDLTDNQIRDMRPVTKLINLIQLRVSGNPIKDRTPLQALSEKNLSLEIDISLEALSPMVHIMDDNLPPLYWVDAATTGFYRLVGNKKVVENVVLGIGNVIDLDIDAKNGNAYWAEQSSKTRGRVRSIDFSDSIVKARRWVYTLPLSIVLDSVRRKAYYASSGGKIHRINFDGSADKFNFVTDLDTPKHLTLDAASEKIYWTETGGTIRYTDLNGSSVQTLFSGLGSLVDIAIADRHIYWIEKTGENAGRLRRANIDGTRVQSLASLRNAPLALAVDSKGRKVYWTNARGRIQRANLNGKNIQTVVTGLSRPIDIVIQTMPVDKGAAAPPLTLTIPSVETQLGANYPNPFNPETWIPYRLSETAEVTLRIYAVDGTLLRTLVLGELPAGVYEGRNRAAYWDGRNELGEPVASGIYFYTLSAGDFEATRKMLIRK